MAGIALTHELAVVRHEDLLVVRFRLYNLLPARDRLRKASTGDPAYVVVELGPQAVGEAVAVQGASPAAPVPATLAAPSRLAFVVDPATQELPYDLDALLDWSHWAMRVAPAADPSVADAARLPVVPTDTQTAIEVPWGLVLSPSPSSRWRHVSRPAAPGGRTELWHTRLAADGATGTAPLWAVAPPSPLSAPAGWELPLSKEQRGKVVRATCAGELAAARPVQASNLVLSALGSTIDLKGTWNGKVTGIDGWRHRSSTGRDHFVQVDEPGYLYPFGHRAALVTVTERRITTGTAKLFRRQFIVLRQPVKDYRDASAVGLPYEGRGLPFRRVRVTTQVSPDVPGENERDFIGMPLSPDRRDRPFWVTTAQQPRWKFLFGIAAEDWGGRVCEFTMPLVFVPVEPPPKGAAAEGPPGAYRPDKVKPLNQMYSKAAEAGSSDLRRPLNGQRVTFARWVPGGGGVEPGHTTLETSWITFAAMDVSDGAGPPDLQNNDQPAFYPCMHRADVRLDAAEAVSGRRLEAATMKFLPFYLERGFDPSTNPVGLFASVTPTSVEFPADRAGGLVTPNVAITGLAAETGPVAGDWRSLAKLESGDPAPAFGPKAYFSSPKDGPVVPVPKLLGDLRLTDLIAPGPPEQAPKIATTTVYPGGDGRQPPDAVVTEMRWTPALQSIDKLFVPEDGAALTLRSTTRTRLNGPQPSEAVVTGELRNFTLALFGVIKIRFNILSFVSRDGAKPAVDVDIGSVAFDGPLRFVNTLSQIMQKAGQGGLAVAADPGGVRASTTLALPSVGAGVFALQNLTLVAGLAIPFDGSPVTARFGFSTRESPFILTVSLFGGTGYVDVAARPNQLQRVEVAIGFGAAIAFSVGGFASGGVSVMAGVTMTLETKTHEGITSDQSVALGGFLQIIGAVEVIGLVSVSISLYMKLEWQKNRVEGSALLALKVEVAFFSKSFSATVRRSFGGGGDPPFAEMVDGDDWARYCAAFGSD